MILISNPKSTWKGAGKITKFFAKRGGFLGRIALANDNRRTHRQMRKNGFL